MKHQGTKRMETERLILRRFTIGDAGGMYRNWASDPEVTKFLPWETYASEETAVEWLTALQEEYKKADTYTWCLEWKETGEPIGSLGAFVSNEKAESLRIGYCIGRKFWHQGIVAEALKTVVKFLTEEVLARRLEASHDVKNINSGRVLRKCGFQYEGTAIQAGWNNTGICDFCLYGLVKGYQGRKEPEQETLAAEPEQEALAAESKQEAAAAEPGQESAASKNSKIGLEPEFAVKNVISDDTIEYVGILAKLELSAEEKEQAKRDMGRMLDYVNLLNELDTEGVEPMSHVFPVHNVFREDVVENGDDSKAMLKNAPEQKDGSFKVPKTVE